MDDDFLHDLFAPFGRIDIKRMFSGRGIYARGVIFAIVSRDGTLHFKTDESTREAYAAEGAKPLSFTKKNGQHMVTSYWRLPERLYDDPDELVIWARAAVNVAAASAAEKAKPRAKAAVKAATQIKAPAESKSKTAAKSKASKRKVKAKTKRR